MDMQKLLQKREKLAADLKALDAKIAAARKRQEAAEIAELVRLLKAKNITPDRIRAMLESSQNQGGGHVVG